MSRGIAERRQAEADADRDTVLWDVVEEHLDEAEFGLERFSAVLDSATLTLDNLADVEALLEAHVDGLVVGGKPVAERLLLPLLADSEVAPARIAAAALALLAAGEIEPVAAALVHASPIVRKGAFRAGQLAANPRFDAAVSRGLSLDVADRGALVQLAAERRLAIPPLLSLLASSVEAEQVGALRAATPADQQQVDWVEHLMGSTNERVRQAAMLAGLEYGSHQAWGLCQSVALRSAQPNPLALALFAGLADPTQQAQLYQLTLSARHKYAVLGCLGYTGSAALVPWLIQQAGSEDERTAKLAGEAFSVITGAPENLALTETANQPGTPSTLPAEDEETKRSLPPLEEDDLGADLAPSEEDALPRPNAPALATWWQANGGRFDARFRYLAGAPYTLDTFRLALETFPLRRRHVLSALLAVRTAGALRLDTRAFARTQRARLAQIPSGHTPWARQYSGF